MRNLYNLLLLIITVFIANNLQSQDLVVNEYQSEYLNTYARIELLVVKDYLDLRGFYIRDSHEHNWNAGIRFKYNNLWNNLKAGTCIILYLDGDIQQEDADLENGLIKVSASDNRYFDFVDTNLRIDTSNANRIKIDLDCEVIEILDKGKNHVHSASHGVQISELHNALPQPKLRANTYLTEASSIAAYPGQYISDYNSEYTANSCIFSVPTIGTANNIKNSISSNANLWHTLRKPMFDYLNIKYSVRLDSIEIIWNKLKHKDVYHDRYGYLVLLGKKEELKNLRFVGPISGFTYQKGESINKWIIAAKLIGSDNSKIKIENNLDDEVYLIKVVPFAFISDSSFESTSGLGSSYNNSSDNIIEINPFSYVTNITLQPTKSYLCNKDSALIHLDFNSPHRTKWFRNNILLDNGLQIDSLWVKDSGDYHAEVYTESNKLLAKSDTVSIKNIELQMKFDDTILDQDTTIYSCSKDTYKLELIGDSHDLSVKWFLNSNLISTNTKIDIKSNGNYTCLVFDKSQNLIWESPSVSNREKFISLIPSDKHIIIPNNSRILFWFTNKSNEDVLIQKESFYIDSPFKLSIKKVFPLFIKKDSVLQFELKYINYHPNSDTTYGKLLYEDECGNTHSYHIKGYNNYYSPRVVTDDNHCNFGTINNCVSDTISMKYYTQALEGARLKVKSNNAKAIKVFFENKSDAINVDDIFTGDLFVSSLSGSQIIGNQDSDIELSAFRNDSLLFVATIPVFINYENIDYSIEILDDALYYCLDSDWSTTAIRFKNNSKADIEFDLASAKNIKFTSTNLKLLANADTLLLAKIKYNATGTQEFEITDEICNYVKEFNLKTERIVLDFEKEIYIENKGTNNTYLLTFPVYSNNSDIYDLINFLYPNSYEEISRSIINDTMFVDIEINLNQSESGIDTIKVENSCCNTVDYSLIYLSKNNPRIVHNYKEVFQAKPIEIDVKQIMLKNSNKKQVIINNIEISDDSFVVSEDVTFPIIVNDTASFDVFYTNHFKNDTATLVIYYSFPFEFKEEVLLIGKTIEDFELSAVISADDTLNVERLQDYIIETNINISDDYAKYIDTLEISIKSNKDNYKIFEDTIQSKIYAKKIYYESNDSSSLITLIEPEIQNNTLLYNLKLQALANLHLSLDSIDISAEFCIGKYRSKECYKQIYINFEILNTYLEKLELSNTIVNIKGKNPINSRSLFEVSSKIDFPLDIYLINEIGKKYDIEVIRNENIYYFYIDVNTFPRGSYTLVVKAQSRLFTRRIIILD